MILNHNYEQLSVDFWTQNVEIEKYSLKLFQFKKREWQFLHLLLYLLHHCYCFLLFPIEMFSAIPAEINISIYQSIRIQFIRPKVSLNKSNFNI